MRGGRRLAVPIVALLLFVLAVLVWVGSDKRVGKQTFVEYSVLNTSDQGLSLAYRYLRAQLPPGRVQVLTRSVDPSELPRDGVILRITPSVMSMHQMMEEMEEEQERRREKKKPDDQTRGDEAAEEEKTSTENPLPDDRRAYLLTPSEEEWIYEGGRLVLALSRRWNDVKVSPSALTGAVKVFPIWPGLSELEPLEGRVLTGPVLRRAHSIFVSGDAPVVARVPLGKGDVILSSIPEVFRNDRIGRADHLVFLHSLADGRPVFFDEVVHGIRDDAGLVELMRRWRLGPFLLLLLAAFVLWFWRSGRRVGPADVDYVDRRSEAVDLVASLGELYRAVMTRGEAVALYAKALRHAVAARTGLRGEALRKRIEQLLDGRPLAQPSRQHALSTEEFKTHLDRINEGFRRLEHERRR